MSSLNSNNASGKIIKSTQKEHLHCNSMYAQCGFKETVGNGNGFTKAIW